MDNKYSIARHPAANTNPNPEITDVTDKANEKANEESIIIDPRELSPDRRFYIVITLAIALNQITGQDFWEPLSKYGITPGLEKSPGAGKVSGQITNRDYQLNLNGHVLANWSEPDEQGHLRTFTLSDANIPSVPTELQSVISAISVDRSANYA